MFVNLACLLEQWLWKLTKTTKKKIHVTLIPMKG